jgi:hypothetical protein
VNSSFSLRTLFHIRRRVQIIKFLIKSFYKTCIYIHICICINTHGSMLARINAYIKTHVIHILCNRMATITLALNMKTPTACSNTSQQVEVCPCV